MAFLRFAGGGLARLLAAGAARDRVPALVIAPPRAYATSQTQPAEADDGAVASGGGWGETKISSVLAARPQASGAWLWCSQDDTVLDAVRKMTKGNVGSLLVFDPSKLSLQSGDQLKSASSDAVAGIVTERDYLTKVVVSGKKSSDLKVAEIMTKEEVLKTVSPSDTVLAAMELMIDHNFRHVPVVDSGNYLGMVSIRDAVRCMVVEHREEVDKLHEYIQGSY